MSFTSRRMIRGWLTEVPSWRGRDGTRIPAFGMAARTSPSEWASESATTGVLDGAGIAGDLIGTTDMQLLAAAGITPGATRFITGTPTTEVEGRAAELITAATSTGAEAQAVEFPTAATSTEAGGAAADFPAVPAQRTGLSTATSRRREDTLHPAVRAALARAPSAASRRADKPRPIRHGEAPASAEHRVAAVEHRGVAEVEDPAVAAEEDRVAAGAGIINQSSVMFLMVRKIWKWREAICGQRS